MSSRERQKQKEAEWAAEQEKYMVEQARKDARTPYEEIGEIDSLEDVKEFLRKWIEPIVEERRQL